MSPEIVPATHESDGDLEIRIASNAGGGFVRRVSVFSSDTFQRILSRECDINPDAASSYVITVNGTPVAASDRPSNGDLLVITPVKNPGN